MKYWFNTTLISRNRLKLIMNTFIFYFFDLKNKILFNKTSYCIGITQIEEALVPRKYRMEITSHWNFISYNK
jgi:hypothetical protein